jgi:hypothetical protein
MRARHGIRTAALVALVVACAVPAGAQQPPGPGVDRFATPPWSTDSVVEVSLPSGQAFGDPIGPASQVVVTGILAGNTYAGNLKPFKASDLGMAKTTGLNRRARVYGAGAGNELAQNVQKWLNTPTIKAAGTVNALLNFAEPLGYALEGDYTDATKSVVQNGLQNVTSMASASALGASGVWLGAPAGPVGMVVGGLVGSIVGAVIGSMGYDAVAKEGVQKGLNWALDETPAADKKRRADEAWASRQDFLKKKQKEENPEQYAADEARERAAKTELDQARQAEDLDRQRKAEAGEAIPVIPEDCQIATVQRDSGQANNPRITILYTIRSGTATATHDVPSPEAPMHGTFNGTVRDNIIEGTWNYEMGPWTSTSGNMTTRYEMKAVVRVTLVLRTDGSLRGSASGRQIIHWECLSGCESTSNPSGQSVTNTASTVEGSWGFHQPAGKGK